jgi:hypothetical protein
MIPIICECGKNLKVKPEYAGKKVRCPACKIVLKVPDQQIDVVEYKKPSLVNQTGTLIQGVGNSITNFIKDTKEASKKTELARVEVSKKTDVQKVTEKVTEILTLNEQIICVAIQKKPVVNFFQIALLLQIKE